jgi:signal transduction histidine kinase
VIDAKVLVVDDEDAGRFVKTQTLRRAGFVVIEAATGAEAIQLASAERPDLVVLDVNLPDISGLEVCRRLRTAQAEMPALQILQISGTAISPADRVRGLETGADVYLTEPVDGSVLVATVNALLRVRHAELALGAAADRERQARKQAEEASRLKDEFIATLSHELRTPLNALMGWIWQLRHTALTEEARGRALDSLERNAQMQAQLINDLLDVSRISKGKLLLQMRLVDLRRTVESAVDVVRAAVERQHLSLALNLESVCVAGDQARLQQVVINLLTNAVQFTPHGGRIAVDLHTSGEEAVLAVRDTGSGINPAFLPHIFDQFRQGEGGVSRRHGGLGLGLTVVKQLIDLHDGSVTAESAGPGQGTTFTIRLPRENVSAGTRADALLEGITVIVSACNRADLDSLCRTLESSGAHVAARDADAHKADRTVVSLGCDDKTLELRVESASSADLSRNLGAAATPSAIVREVARLVARARMPEHQLSSGSVQPDDRQ